MPVQCFVDPCMGVDCADGYDCIADYCGGCYGDCILSEEDCVDFTDIDFGMCDMFLGYGWTENGCQGISGCGWDNNGIDYSNFFFNSFEECDSACSDIPEDSDDGDIEIEGMYFNADGTKQYVLGTAGTLMIDGGEDELPYSHVARSQNTMTFLEGNTYVFDVSQTALVGHSLKFSTTVDGTHKAGGTEYVTGVSSSGSPGTPGATTTIIVPSKTPSTEPGSAVDKLYYYNGGHPSQGGEIFTPEWKGNLQITYTNGLDDIDTRYKTKHLEDIFEDSVLWKRGLAFTVVNGNLTIEMG